MMSDKPSDKDLLPNLLAQNPSPVTGSGQGYVDIRRKQVDNIMEVFLQMLPSNYVAQVQGPFYTVQFQAIAETIADIQIAAQEVFSDRDFDCMRPEFMFQLLGTLVFPDAKSDGYPNLKGDITYRTFLKRMVALLLQGATKDSVQGGLDLLTDAVFEVVEKVLTARETKRRVWNKTTGQWETKPGSSWGLEDQFEFEVNISYTDPNSGLQRFPIDPFILQENARIVLRALKPAHTLYEYRHLFQEVFGTLFSDENTWDLSNYYYEDFRRFWAGAKELVGVAGVTWTDKSLFSDSTRDFSHIQAGASVTITSGPNGIHSGGVEGTPASMDAKHIGRYRVVDVMAFPVGTDTTARAYTTSPTNLTGTVTVTDDVVEDSTQDFGVCVEGETITITSGPNAGTYRMKHLLGSNGGPVGFVSGPATRVRISPSLLRLERRMRYAASGQAYTIVVDRLGVQVNQVVSQEDASLSFVL